MTPVRPVAFRAWMKAVGTGSPRDVRSLALVRQVGWYLEAETERDGARCVAVTARDAEVLRWLARHGLDPMETANPLRFFVSGGSAPPSVWMQADVYVRHPASGERFVLNGSRVATETRLVRMLTLPPLHRMRFRAAVPA